MKNWNTNVPSFPSNHDKIIWELVQKIEYGLDHQTLKKADMIHYWAEIKNQISKENRRLFEFLLWGKTYSLTTKDVFWTRPKTQI